MDCCFPEVIMYEILTRVPAKDLLRFKIVCKPWYLLISDRKFVKDHLARAPQEIVFTACIPSGYLTVQNEVKYISINTQDLTILPELHLDLEPYKKYSYERLWVNNSCDGLLLSVRRLSVYNPITRKFKAIPAPPGSVPRVYLVHDDSIDKYKIVAIDGRKCRIFTLESGDSCKWRELDEILVDAHFLSIKCSDFLFVRNELHWVTTVIGNGSDDEVARYVFSLDVSEEKIKKTEVPIRQAFVGRRKSFRLSELEGSLCLTTIMKDQLEIQVLEKNGDKCEWATLYRVESHSMPNKPAFLENLLAKQIEVVWVPSGEPDNVCNLPKLFIHYGDQLFVFDVKTHVLKQIASVNSCFEANCICKLRATFGVWLCTSCQ